MVGGPASCNGAPAKRHTLVGRLEEEKAGGGLRSRGKTCPNPARKDQTTPAVAGCRNMDLWPAYRGRGSGDMQGSGTATTAAAPLDVQPLKRKTPSCPFGTTDGKHRRTGTRSNPGESTKRHTTQKEK
ncbi:hypothetical protein MAPG_04352 [Magnaporthiopsis poae ATCC 64411]|uniref:Uncharacterized protein n=1 Tax=Magnaporthiopsis poae (strain ATCC 64411 / 73-15) TaxID=644358 RepID=A0A0C4DWH2_MAGP6|nr:hypothetical protein MAPG_04352 [Magnaporthiopsis poae ATCC 64411]